ncbi:hypothetical protein ES703_95563 [subsurface metagenome]
MENKELSLTDQIYQELVDGLKTGLDWPHFLAEHKDSKGPTYNAIGRFLHDMEPKVRALGEVQAKLDQRGLELGSLDQRIKEAENSLAPLEERRNVLNEQIETLETKLAEKSELVKQVGELEKLGFDINMLRQLKDALTEIGARHGFKGKEAVSKFFKDLKDYEAVLGAETLLQGLQTQIETKKLEAENWQAKEEALRRKHDDLKAVIEAVGALRAKNIKVSEIIAWHQVFNHFETVEQFNASLAQYADIMKLLNARKKETEACELRLAQAKSEVGTLEKEKVKIKAAIDTLEVAGIKEIKAITEATEKQLKAVAAKEIGETRAVGQEVRKEFGNLFTQVDQLLEKVFQLGQKWEGINQEFQKYEGVRNALESHAATSEEVNEPIPK